MLEAAARELGVQLAFYVISVGLRIGCKVAGKRGHTGSEAAVMVAWHGGCVDGNVDNEWVGAWGRQKGRQ